MPVKKNTDLIPVRPRRRNNKVAIVRDVVFMAVISSFVVLAYIGHMETVAYFIAVMFISIFLMMSLLLKAFVGEGFIHMLYFNIKREREWK